MGVKTPETLISHEKWGFAWKVAGRNFPQDTDPPRGNPILLGCAGKFEGRNLKDAQQKG